MQTNRPTALIAMSGGVDSSVAAWLMQQAGYDCVGATMKLFDHQDSCACSTTADIQDARVICARLGIPHYTFDFADTFAEQVVKRFVTTYAQGATPNPCIDCNRFLKFGLFIRRAREMGFDCVATGHYARVEFDNPSGRYLLRTAVDANKDQSYVLYGLTQEQLAYVRFPLGSLAKEQVRATASQLGFHIAQKEESQDICFIPAGDHASFIRQWMAEHAEDLKIEPGLIIDAEGKKLGAHDGIINFTIGQRKGIGIAAAAPLYVKEIVATSNTVIVAPRAELGATIAVLEDANLISGACFEQLQPSDDVFTQQETIGHTKPLRVFARHRYRCTPRSAQLEQLGPTTLKVTYDEPVSDLARGQALVCYDSLDNAIVLAGGTIMQTT
ncbi:MAG: tRNA 2-thiouridine(34) synthase MnmA [Coriobacteriia bacterium]|nr:tRNA 2-thiouridine(34) synthase MnmA [Coriobacteriia bacterium]